MASEIEYKVTRGKVIEASKKCPDARMTLQTLFPEAFEFPLKQNGIYKWAGEFYLLARTDTDKHILICLTDGNRMVEHNTMSKKLFGSNHKSFEYIGQSEELIVPKLVVIADNSEVD